MTSENFFLGPSLTLHVKWSRRLVNLLDEYQARCARARGVGHFEFNDDNLESARKEMDAAESKVIPFVKRIYERTGQLPFVGDYLDYSHEVSQVDDIEVYVAERRFSATYKVPNQLCFVLSLDTNHYDGYPEIGYFD